jgi:hypothetical protein
MTRVACSCCLRGLFARFFVRKWQRLQKETRKRMRKRHSECPHGETRCATCVVCGVSSQHAMWVIDLLMLGTILQAQVPTGTVTAATTTNHSPSARFWRVTAEFSNGRTCAHAQAPVNIAAHFACGVPMPAEIVPSPPLFRGVRRTQRAVITTTTTVCTRRQSPDGITRRRQASMRRRLRTS